MEIAPAGSSPPRYPAVGPRLAGGVAVAVLFSKSAIFPDGPRINFPGLPGLTPPPQIFFHGPAAPHFTADRWGQLTAIALTNPAMLIGRPVPAGLN